MMSCGVRFTMKTAYWRQNKHHKLEFEGQAPAGHGMMLWVTGSAKIFLSI
jgi:hypothetical protein